MVFGWCGGESWSGYVMTQGIGLLETEVSEGVQLALVPRLQRRKGLGRAESVIVIVII